MGVVFPINRPFVFTDIDMEQFKKNSEDSRRISKERLAKRDELKRKKEMRQR